ncbi:MAG TPA: hypothetical protein VFO86_00100, partial [Terriglobia bacterium]|nr:hypothetical protein [Terriglobia bacterium]
MLIHPGGPQITVHYLYNPVTKQLDDFKIALPGGALRSNDMRVNAIQNKFVDCPPATAAIGSPESETHLSLGKTYEVFALPVLQGVVFFRI